ncbi:hypothetical protein CC78DRAFT_546534 [Lojkania enalia]|uniref:Uncharacterized protein n=1 Tax=Lojkania enalia TaxID=147567 RepID=A0A9P4K497_9PLEO|nr:hypothetical protein CC78DRAFT_546534 [Didymosphaeria enalia]
MARETTVVRKRRHWSAVGSFVSNTRWLLPYDRLVWFARMNDHSQTTIVVKCHPQLRECAANNCIATLKRRAAGVKPRLGKQRCRFLGPRWCRASRPSSTRANDGAPCAQPLIKPHSLPARQAFLPSALYAAHWAPSAPAEHTRVRDGEKCGQQTSTKETRKPPDQGAYQGPLPAVSIPEGSALSSKERQQTDADSSSIRLLALPPGIILGESLSVAARPCSERRALKQELFDDSIPLKRRRILPSRERPQIG